MLLYLAAVRKTRINCISLPFLESFYSGLVSTGVRRVTGAAPGPAVMDTGSRRM